MNNKYYRYQLTFPFISNKMYRSSSLKNIIIKCYEELKNSQYYTSTEYFGITNLDRNVEYKFKINCNNQIEKNVEKNIEKNIEIMNEHLCDSDMRDLFDNIDIQDINKKYKSCVII